MDGTLSSREKTALVNNLKTTAIERIVLRIYGLSETEAENFGAFDESALSPEEADELVEKFITEAYKDPAVFRSS